MLSEYAQGRAAMHYSNEQRGKILNPARKRQLVNYSGLRYCKITPTDLDGFLEISNRLYIFYELKYHNAEFAGGQKSAYLSMIDTLQTALGKNGASVLLVCRHETDDPEKEIDASECIVDKYYYRGKWRSGKGLTAKQVTDIIIRKVLPERAGKLLS